MSALSGRLARRGASSQLQTWASRRLVVASPISTSSTVANGTTSARTLHTHRNALFQRLHRPRVIGISAQAVPPGLRGMHVRALSFSSLGKAALRGLRLPVFAGTAALGTAAGTLAMANKTANRECQDLIARLSMSAH